MAVVIGICAFVDDLVRLGRHFVSTDSWIALTSLVLCTIAVGVALLGSNKLLRVIVVALLLAAFFVVDPIVDRWPA